MSKNTKTPKPAKKSRYRKSKGALTAIGTLLLASAVLRVGIGTTEAMAREGTDLLPQVSEAASSESTANGASGAGIQDQDIPPLLAALKEREARIEKRESSVAVRMQALSVAEQEIEQKLAALEQAEQKLRATMTMAKTAAEDDVAKLTDVYANMKPKQAAALFEEMDPKFAAGFLARMRPDNAAAIMAGLMPSTAYTISVVLAGRNAEVPNE